jgi:hypothetical protein
MVTNLFKTPGKNFKSPPEEYFSTFHLFISFAVLFSWQWALCSGQFNC